MIRILTLMFGLLGAAGLSQFPEFSQQYLQRLAGAVDELSRVVRDFDASAAGVGMTRDQALASLTEGEFQEKRREDMTRTIARSERLGADLEALRASSMVSRALQPQRFTDPEIVAAAWKDFKPAIPVTPTGAGFAGVGFFAGLFFGWPSVRLIGWPLRRLRRRKPQRQMPPPLRAPRDAGPRTGLPIAWLARTNNEPAKVVQEGEAVEVSVAFLQEGERRMIAPSPHGEIVFMPTDGTGQIEDQTGSRTLEGGQLAMIPRSMSAEIVAHTALRLIVIMPKAAPRAALTAVRGKT